MNPRHKTLNGTQVLLLGQILAIYEQRAEQSSEDQPERCRAYTLAADLLRTVLYDSVGTAQRNINTYAERIIPASTQSQRRRPPYIGPSDPCSDEMTLTKFAQLLHTITTDGTDESKEENLRRWNQE